MISLELLLWSTIIEKKIIILTKFFVGKSRSRDVKSKRKKRKKIEDWDEEEIPDMKEEDEDYLEDKIIRRKGK